MQNPTKKTKSLAVSAVVTLLLGSTSALAAPYVYIPMGGDNVINVVDAETGEIVDTYKGVEAVHGLAQTPDGQFLVAGSYSEREPGAEAPMKPEGVSADEHAAHHAKPKADAPAGDAQVSTVSILKRATGELMRAIDVPGAVHHVTVSPDGRFAALTQPGYDAISVVDLTSYEVVATVKTGSLPNYMVFSPDSSKLYVSNAGDNKIAVVGTKHWMVTSEIATGESPEHMVLSQDGKTLYVNDNDAGTVSAIDLASGTVTDTYKIGERLHGLDITDDGSALLVAERDGDKVARIDLATGAVSKRDLPPEPYHLTSIPGTGLAFVSSSDEPTIKVISQADMGLVNTIEVGSVGHQMVVADSR